VGASLIAMLSCKEVSRTIAANELGSANWRRRISVKLHLLMCRHCRRYVRQIEAIGAATRQVFGEQQRPAPDSNEQLRQTILDRIQTCQEEDSETRV